MKRYSTIIIAVVILLITSRCAWLDKSESLKIIGNYEIGWNDLESNRAIVKPNNEICDGCYDMIVDNYVYSVGHNNRFIYAKQHPNLDTTITKYFLIDLNKNQEDVKKGIYGPLEEEEFKNLLTTLRVDEIKFDINFPERVW